MSWTSSCIRPSRLRSCGSVRAVGAEGKLTVDTSAGLPPSSESARVMGPRASVSTPDSGK
ncbi:hypothetical protein GCM10027033_27650 [Leucobacter ruminantium]